VGTALQSTPQFQQFEARIQNVELSVRSALNDTFSQIMERLDAMESRQPVTGAGSAGTAPEPLPLPPGSPRNVLSRFFWVEKSVVQSISDGDFAIHDLPKLFREENQRTRHKAKVTEGIHFPADGGKPELVTGRTKMQSAFPNLDSFLSAWLVYVAIRSTFSPERAVPFAYWTERLIFFHKDGFQWSDVLNYAIAYYSAHQNSPADTWYDINTDHQLAIHHFTVARKSTTGGNPTNAPHRPPLSKQNSTPIHEQVCQNWNRVGPFGCTYKDKNGVPCPRKHQCAICSDPSHKAPDCPKKKAT
jgi:hypothetical protein